MSDCFEPGRLVVLPNPGVDIDGIIETPNDVLADSDISERAKSVPKLLEVAIGEELLGAHELFANQKVLAAVPNYFLSRAGSDVEFEESTIERLLAHVGINQPIPNAGAGMKVAVLDSGWNGNAAAVERIQEYFADVRQRPGTDSDATGHGTTVVELVRRIAPQADVRSVRICNQTGSLWSLICGLFLAEAAFSPDIVNISGALKCGNCVHCNRGSASSDQLELLFWSFRSMRRAPAPIVVAAAGNRQVRCLPPASLANVIAVGAFEYARRAPAAYSIHSAVPVGRFVMAPGGSVEQPVSRTRRQGASSGTAALYGTSFAAPIVTGMLAVGLAELKCAACNGIHGWHQDSLGFALESLATCADRSFPGYNPARHGLGAVTYRPSGAYETLPHAGMVLSGIARNFPAEFRATIQADAQAVYDERGKPMGKDDEHWWEARRRNGIPLDLHV